MFGQVGGIFDQFCRHFADHFCLFWDHVDHFKPFFGPFGTPFGHFGNMFGHVWPFFGHFRSLWRLLNIFRPFSTLRVEQSRTRTTIKNKERVKRPPNKNWEPERRGSWKRGAIRAWACDAKHVNRPPEGFPWLGFGRKLVYPALLFEPGLKKKEGKNKRKKKLFEAGPRP